MALGEGLDFELDHPQDSVQFSFEVCLESFEAEEVDDLRSERFRLVEQGIGILLVKDLDNASGNLVCIGWVDEDAQISVVDGLD